MVKEVEPKGWPGSKGGGSGSGTGRTGEGRSWDGREWGRKCSAIKRIEQEWNYKWLFLY